MNDQGLRIREWIFSSEDSKTEHKVTDIRLYADDKEKIELEFKPVRIPDNGDIRWEDWNCYDSVCVYRSDYEKLLSSFIESLFPVEDPDPYGWGIQETMDYTSMNFMGRDDWAKMTDLIISAGESSEEQEKEFYRTLAHHLRDAMKMSDYFCIEGNL